MEVLCNTEGDLKCCDCILNTDFRTWIWTFHTFLGCTTYTRSKQGDYNSVTNSLQYDKEKNCHREEIFDITSKCSQSINYWRLWSPQNCWHTPIYANSCLSSTVQYCTIQCSTVLYCTVLVYCTVHYSTVLSATPTYAGLCTTNKMFHTSRGLFSHSICNNFWYKPSARIYETFHIILWFQLIPPFVRLHWF